MKQKHERKRWQVMVGYGGQYVLSWSIPGKLDNHGFEQIPAPGLTAEEKKCVSLFEKMFHIKDHSAKKLAIMSKWRRAAAAECRRRNKAEREKV